MKVRVDDILWHYAHMSAHVEDRPILRTTATSIRLSIGAALLPLLHGALVALRGYIAGLSGITRRCLFCAQLATRYIPPTLCNHFADLLFFISLDTIVHNAR